MNICRQIFFTVVSLQFENDFQIEYHTPPKKATPGGKTPPAVFLGDLL